MFARLPVLRPAPAPGVDLQLRFDGRALPADPRDTVATALLRSGILGTSRSIKFRRPRGPFCLQGDCGSCLVRVDGVPNVRACVTPVARHMVVESQNRIDGLDPDPSGLLDQLTPRALDHHHLLVRPKLANEVMQGVARKLAGLGTLAAPVPAGQRSHVHHRPDVLIIGGGRSGLGVAQALVGSDHTVMWLDRRDAQGIRARLGAVPDSLLCNHGVFGIYPREGLVAAMVRGPWDSGNGCLHTFSPRHLVLATGVRATLPALANNDLPGLLSAPGLREALTRVEGTIEGKLVVIGSGPDADQLAEQHRTAVIPLEHVMGILGHGRVRGVQTRNRKLEADLVAVGTPGCAVSELARQAGACVAFNGHGFAIVRDELGRCGPDRPWTTWACGEAIGLSPTAAEDDGIALGHRIRRLASAASGIGAR